MLRQIPQVLAHLRRTGRAVQPDQVDAERLEGGQRGTDLGTEQHRAGGLHRHVGDDRDPATGLLHRPLAADDRGLRLQQVLAGLHEDRVGTTVEHAQCRLTVGVAQHSERCVAEGGQLRTRTHRPDHHAGHAVGTGAHLVGDSRARRVRARTAHGCGRRCRSRRGWAGCSRRCSSRRRRAGLEVRPVDPPDHIGTRFVEDLVAPLQTAEVVEREIRGLQHGAHRPVSDDNALGQRIEQDRMKWGGHALQTSGARIGPGRRLDE